MMSEYDFDLIVIGAGSGGVRASRLVASYGARVAVIEDRYMGGTCVNVGCVPKKLYVYASSFSNAFTDARGFGWQSDTPAFDWATLRDNKKAEITRLNGIYNNLLDNSHVTIINGRGRLTNRHTVAVGEQHYTAEKILIATGGWPFIPEFPGHDLATDSNDIFDLDHFPQRVVIVGGGYIAVEFAGIFHGLGANTSLLYRGPLFLRGFDEDVRRVAAREIEQTGITLRFNTNPSRIERNSDNSLTVTLEDSSTINADVVLYATGRKANTQGLGLEDVGVQLNDDGTIIVDDNFRTSVENIFALGDVTGGVELTPVAIAEAMAFAKTQFNLEPTSVNREFIPTAVFCQPSIGTCGLTEDQARQRYNTLRIYDTDFRAMKHTLGGRNERTYMKMIVDDQSDRVIGIHMVGDDAGEIIQGLAVAMTAGATKADFDNTIGIHPTAAEEFVTMRQARD